MQWLEDTSGQNFHANHHLVHTKNYGIYNSLLDMYFTTATHNTQYRCPVYCVLYCPLNNTEYRIKPSLYCEGAENLVFEVEKKVEEEDICFVFTPVTISS